MGILMASLDGADTIHDVAYVGQGLLGDPAMIVLCATSKSATSGASSPGSASTGRCWGSRRSTKPGPGGNYLTADHGFQHFRRRVWQPTLVNRDNPDTWAQKGGLRHKERVIQKTLRIPGTRIDPSPCLSRSRNGWPRFSTGPSRSWRDAVHGLA